MNNFKYTGNELEIFKFAFNWKNYYYAKIINHFKPGNVLEVGAGIGEITKLFHDIWSQFSWICVEPDEENVTKIKSQIQNKNIKVFKGFLEDMNFKNKLFDNILFIDTLEHIENDKETLHKAFKLLNKSGKLIIIVPAHNFLFNEFDKSIGHFRRYNKKMLMEILPQNAHVLLCNYIDSFGFFLSLGNKFILKKSLPSLKQILFWDNYIIPISRIFDKILLHKFGKNIILIVKKVK